MTLGIALFLIFILYLIDKHNLWKFAIGLALLMVFAIGGFWWLHSLQDHQLYDCSAASANDMRGLESLYPYRSGHYGVFFDLGKMPKGCKAL